MLPLGYKSLAEHRMKVLYRAWEGQLFIQNQRVCNIVLRSPFQASIPAQLPAKLEFKYIVRISELRKKLPEAAFRKNSYSNDEVCCQQLSFRLYQVEILDESELKDQLIGSMKEKNLALVKYLNDRGILLFLTSSVLAKEKDAETNDLSSLQALFLFPSPGPKHLTASDWKREEGRSETPRQLPLILPLLHQALARAAKNPNPKQSSSSALVKRHMEEVANLDQRSVLNCDNPAGSPLTSKLSPETPKGEPMDDTGSPSSFSNLVFYLSDPESYTLEVSSAAACLKGCSWLSDGCAGLNLDPSPSDRPDKAAGTGKAPLDRRGPGRDAASKSSPSGERSLPWTKRKSSRILGASSKKKWSPLKMYCILESSKKKTNEKEKRKKKKKKKKLPKEAMSLNIPLAKDPESPADPKRPTLKLKNILNPLRRKRGAEVLSAEFIQGPRSVLLEGATGSSGGPSTEEKKPRLNMPAKVKNVDKMAAKGPTPKKNIHNVSSEKQRTEGASVEKDTAVPDSHRTPPGGEECDSHALNLLADLALSSCNSPLDGNNRRDFGRSRPSREHRLSRGKFLHKSSDHEYHTKKRKGVFLPGQTSRSSLWPAKESSRDKDWPLNANNRSTVNPGKKKKARSNLAKTSLALPNETGDLSDSSVIISLEHSYASPVSEMPTKAPPHSPNSRNGVKQDKPGLLVGKVLPFQHQQNSCQMGKPVTNHLPPARSTVLANRLREDFSTSRQVTSRDKTVQVTFQCEAEYVFDLDSKYTNNSLEKTIIRAIHGPWDESLSDEMEDMKLILHMWLALFYNKPLKALTVRKVVEHSNPAKYVSLNSLVDPLEPMDDGGGPPVLEKRPAGSLPEAVQVPAEGGEGGPVSPSQKLLPGNEVSSNDSLDDGSPLIKLEEAKDLLEKEDLAHPPPKAVDEVVKAEPKEHTSLLPVLPIENLPGVDERVNPPICQTKTDRSQETVLVETSQNDASVPTGPPEGSRNQQPLASTEVAVPVSNRGTDVASSSEEVKKDNLPVGGPNPRTWNEVELKADARSWEPTNPGNEVGNQPRLRTDERDGESVDLRSIDLALSKSNDADMEVQDMDLVSEDEEDPVESDVKGREETDGLSDDMSSRHGPLSSRASSPDASSGHRTEFPGVQEAAVGPSSTSVSPNQMGLMDMAPQQGTLFHPMMVDEKMVGSTSTSVSPNHMELMGMIPQQGTLFHPMMVDEKMVGSTSTSVSPNHMELMGMIPQQGTSFHPMTVEEKMVGSTSTSASPNHMELMGMIPQQGTLFHPMMVDEKMVGSTSTSASPNHMELMGMIPQQGTSFHPMTVEEKMVGSTSTSVSPNHMELMGMIPQQGTSFHPVTVEEKMVGSTSTSASPNHMELMGMIPQQGTLFHPMMVDEKMVGSTSTSASPNHMELMGTVPQQETSFHPVTVEEKMVGSTSTSASPNHMELMGTVPQQETSFHPVTVEEKMVGSTSTSASPNHMELMGMIPQQETLFHPVTVEEKMVGSTSTSASPNHMDLMGMIPQQETDEKMVGSTSTSISPNQMGLMDMVPQQGTSFHPMTLDEKMVGSTSTSASPNHMELMDMVPQQGTSYHPVTVEEQMVGSATDPMSPKQPDEVGNLNDEAILADSASTEASRDSPNDRATPDGPLPTPQEPVGSPRVPSQVDVVDLSSVSQEDRENRLSCLPSWQASPVHQGASDVEPPRIQEVRPRNPLYRIFQNSMDLIEDISQDSIDLANPAVHLCETNDNLCVNPVPNSISTRQESVETQDSSVAFAQPLPLAKEMDLLENPEGDHPASPVHQETSGEPETLEDDSGAKVDLLEDSSILQEKDVIHPTDDVLGRVNEQQLAESDLGIQEEQTIHQGEKIPVDSQPAKEFPSLESHDAESSFKSETCLDQENIRDSSAREEEEEEEEVSLDDGVEKPIVTTTAVAEEVQVLMNKLVDTVCATIVQSEEMRAPKSLGWIDSSLLECVTPPVTNDEGCPTDQDSHADVKWDEECLEDSSSFDGQEEEDLQARVEGRGELGSSSNENTTSHPGDVSEKAEFQGNDATSAATEISSSCGTSQAELDTTSPKSRCSWLETTESPNDYSAKADDYGVSTLEKVGQTEASPEEPICDREDYPRGEDVGNSSFVPAKCQEDSLAEEPGSLVDQDSNEAPEDREEEAQEEAKGCLGSLEDPLPDERRQMSTSSSGMDTDGEDESLTVDGGQDPCVDWYPTKESWYQPRFKASPSIESELTRSSALGNEACKDGDWVSSGASQKTSEAGSVKCNVPFGLKKDCLRSRDMDHKPFKDYINFSVTKKHKEKSRTFHSFSKEHKSFSRDLGSMNSWNTNWSFLSDPIQNILDMESLQFHCRIQELLKRSQRSTSHVLPSKKVPPQGIAERLPSRTVSEGFPTRSKSPLLVTIVNPNPRTGRRYDDIYGLFPASLDPFVPAAAPRSRGGLDPKYPFPSLPLQNLTYHKLNSFSRDISSILEEFAEFSRAMTLESARMCNPGRDLTATSGNAGEIRYPPRPPAPLVYRDLLSELRNALHFQLKNVAQEACRKPFSFYLMETEDDPFFGRVKNLLQKGGHSEVDLLQFCKGSSMETENLLVIVRNEDIFLHIHKVPSLLRLKRCPNVTFAGVDSPEDPLDHTYQELFHSGGFVVSDDNVLEGMAVGELKDLIKTLEKLNSHGRWKWFLHYRESKKLKEDGRGDLVACTKESVLKSCQVANMTEVLHYHKCDSGSCTRFERFNCLFNLQIQHITKRFGVFLTENASANREALEDKGIFSLNITDFIATAQDLVAPFGSGFW